MLGQEGEGARKGDIWGGDSMAGKERRRDGGEVEMGRAEEKEENGVRDFRK